MPRRDFTEDEFMSRYKMWLAAVGASVSEKVEEQETIYSRNFSAQVKERFTSKMAPTLEDCLNKFQTLAHRYDDFYDIEDSTDPMVLIYKTAIQRLKQYHLLCIEALRGRQPFPVWSMFRSMVDTIVVLCKIYKEPGTAKNWPGFDVDGPILGSSIPTPAELLRNCRREAYTQDVKDHIMPVHKDGMHMGIFDKERMALLHTIDHFGGEAVYQVFKRKIMPSRYVITETKGGLIPDEVLYLLLFIFWALIGEGFNHLSLVGCKHLKLPKGCMQNICELLTILERSSSHLRP